MFLNRKDIEKIAGLLEQFKDVENFELVSDTSSGIGAYLTMTFDQEVNGTRGSFTVEISGVDNW